MIRVAVVGGGISGLTAGLTLQRAGCEVHVLEAEGRCGGIIGTTCDGGYRFENGPIGVKEPCPSFISLCEEVEVADELIRARGVAVNRYLYFHGQLHALPRSFREFLRSPLFSLRQKLRILAERFQRRPDPGREESVAEYFGRRLGRGVTLTWVDVLVSGNYAGHPNRLGIASSFPELVRMEAEHGSLVEGIRQRTRARQAAAGRGEAPLFSFPGGLERIVARLGECLGGSLELGCRVRRLARREGTGFRLAVEQADGRSRSLDVDRVVLAIPAPAAGILLAPLAGGVADLLFEVEYASVAVIHAGFDAADLPGLPDGYGFLFPRSVRMRSMGWIFYSKLFPDAAPEGKVALCGRVGGILDPHVMDVEDSHIEHLMMGELGLALRQRRIPRPESFRVVRWRDSIPQPNVGHTRRMMAVRGLLADDVPGLAIAGDGLAGNGIEHCVRRARAAAGEILGVPADPAEATAGGWQ